MRRGELPAIALAAVGVLVVAATCAGVLLLADAVLAAPLWLHLAWAAPLLLLLDVLARRFRARTARRLGESDAVGRLVEGAGRGVRSLRTFLAASALILLAVAAARPQWGVSDEEVRRTGVDVFIAIDTSKSMLAEDVRPNRLARARLEVSSLIDSLGGDRVGLIAFAGSARVVCPLTLDHGTAKLFLDLMDPDVLQRPGTAIGAALRLAGRSFPETSGRHSVIVLITDGEDHEGDALAAARELSEVGIVVHCVGIGEPDGTPIPLEQQGRRGERRVGFLRDQSGEVVMSRLDVAALREIADVTGGIFSQAAAHQLELQEVARAIEDMEGQELATRKTQLRTDRAHWFLAPAFLLLALEAFLPDGGRLVARRRRSRVEGVVSWTRRRSDERPSGRAA